MQIETLTPYDLFDPDIDADALTEIAMKRPDLLAAVAAHPNCPESLAKQIHATQRTLSVEAGDGERRKRLDLSATWPNALVAGAFLVYGVGAFINAVRLGEATAFGLGLAAVAVSAVAVVTMFTTKRWPTVTVAVFSLVLGSIMVFGSITAQMSFGFDVTFSFSGLLGLAMVVGGGFMLRRKKEPVSTGSAMPTSD